MISLLVSDFQRSVWSVPSISVVVLGYCSFAVSEEIRDSAHSHNWNIWFNGNSKSATWLNCSQQMSLSTGPFSLVSGTLTPFKNWFRHIRQNMSQFFSYFVSYKGPLISKCLYEVIVWTKIPPKNLIITDLKGPGQKLANFSVVFWSKRWKPKDILKLTDL